MFATLLFCSLAFAESKALALQIALDRAGFSCNTIDGQWGRKTERALSAYLASQPPSVASGAVDPSSFSASVGPDLAFDRLFSNDSNLFRIETVTDDDIARLVVIPDTPAERAKLHRMGYRSIKEMFAERGHVTENTLARLNPGVNWDCIAAGTRIVIPNFPSIAGEFRMAGRANSKVGARIVVDLGQYEITVYDRKDRPIARFPCSIARSKAKLPPAGELKVVNAIARPNYTYTPDYTPSGRKPKRFVWPEGENCPIGVAWLGLSLPGYGIHGTPHPETIGHAESHGCFRLSNWNAARLYALCPVGTPVIVRP